MRKPKMFHRGSRELQRSFDSTALANRIVDRLAKTEIDANARTLIQNCCMFFLATADAHGRPDCSYKGGLPGFVRVLGKTRLAFPVYDGNGMYKSLGNILVNPRVGLLFIDFEKPTRLRLNGTARIQDSAQMRRLFPGAELVVSVRASAVFPNCPRYVHSMKLQQHSAFIPRPHSQPPEPAWKRQAAFRDVLPGARKARRRKSAPRLAKATRRTALS